MNHEQIFTPQYKDKSGPGSTFEFSAPYREFVERFILEHDITSVLDLGCGDGVVASHLNLYGASYLGVDCIPERVEHNRRLWGHLGLDFIHDDARTFAPQADLVLIKDVIQHWSNVEIHDWLAYLKSLHYPFKFMLVTNCSYGDVNIDCVTGSWRAVDLSVEPFNIGRVVFSWGEPNKNVVLIEGEGDD